jgi:hypothetical protein
MIQYIILTLFALPILGCSKVRASDIELNKDDIALNALPKYASDFRIKNVDVAEIVGRRVAIQYQDLRGQRFTEVHVIPKCGVTETHCCKDLPKDMYCPIRQIVKLQVEGIDPANIRSINAIDNDPSTLRSRVLLKLFNENSIPKAEYNLIYTEKKN